jgi:hypothetical protein
MRAPGRWSPSPRPRPKPLAHDSGDDGSSPPPPHRNEQPNPTDSRMRSHQLAPAYLSYVLGEGRDTGCACACRCWQRDELEAIAPSRVRGPPTLPSRQAPLGSNDPTAVRRGIQAGSHVRCPEASDRGHLVR